MTTKHIDIVMIIGLVLMMIMVFAPVMLLGSVLTPMLLAVLWVGAGVVGVCTMALCEYLEERVNR